MRSHLERVDLFQVEVPQAFLRTFVAQLGRLYPKTLDRVSEIPLEYQRYLRPHILRTDAEIAFLTLAKYHGLETSVEKNRSEDAHGLVLTTNFVITLSRTPGPVETPRWARFRVDYSARLNFHLEGPEFDDYPDPVSVSLEEPRHYVIISHGPQDMKRGWGELGFAYANFVREGARNYSGPGIDLIGKYSEISAGIDVERVQEPEFRPDDNERGTGETGTE